MYKMYTVALFNMLKILSLKKKKKKNKGVRWSLAEILSTVIHSFEYQYLINSCPLILFKRLRFVKFVCG